jgi:apolipoprotein D and lipocalin family protein
MKENKYTKAMKTTFLVSILMLFSVCVKSQETMDKSVVSNFEIERYLGKWYEIARYDHRFERGLVGTTATYSLREDGKIKVENNGYKETLDGEKSTAIGKAKIPNPEEPSKLKVSFFLFFYADYFIMELDKDYNWAVIGSSSDKYLWILSRTPVIEDSLKQEIVKKIEARGYDTQKFIWVKQK